MIRLRATTLIAGALLCAPVSPLSPWAHAQETPTAPETSPDAPALPFRLLDQERMLRETRMGQETLRRVRAAQQAFEDDNQRIFDQLSAEEQALTELRPTLSPTEFRARADEFDARVEEIRSERARLAQELEQSNQRLLRAFYDAALPVLQQVMNEQGVLGLLRSDMMVLSSEVLDITPDVIARLDGRTQPSAPAPGATPAPEPGSAAAPAPETHGE